MTERTEITLTVNGQAHSIRVEARRTLVDAIREDCGQTGTHIGCEHGVCGACTVRVDGKIVRGCLTLAAEKRLQSMVIVEQTADRVAVWHFLDMAAQSPHVRCWVRSRHLHFI